MTTNKRDFLFAALFALFLLLVTPIRFAPDYVFDVKVTATGKMNAHARGSEVWMMFPSFRDIDRWPNKLRLSPGWERKRGVLVSFREQPSTVSFTFNGKTESFLSFASHEYSGLVDLEINGKNLHFDLYSSNPTLRVLPLSGYVDFEKRSYFPSLGKGLSVFLLYWVVLLLLSRAVRGKAVAVRAECPELSKRKTLVFALPSLVIYGLVHLAFWPGQLSPDSIEQWRQVLSNDYSDSHPVISTLIIKLLSIFYQNPAIPIAFQYSLLALVVGLLIAELHNWGAKPFVLFFSSILIPLFPPNYLIATTLWKDVLFTTFFLHLLYIGLVVIRKNWRVSGLFLIFAFIGGFMLSNIRHNGILIAPVFLIGLGLLKAKSTAGRIFVVEGVTVAILFVILKTAVYPMVGIASVAPEYKAIYAVHNIGGMLKRGAALSKQDQQFLSQFMPLAEWKENYQCGSVVPLFWGGGKDGIDFLANNSHRMNMIAIDLAKENPRFFIDHELCLTSFLWQIRASQNDWILLSPGEITPTTINNSLGLLEDSQIPHLKVAIKHFADKFVVNSFLFGRPALWTYFSLFLIVVYSRANGKAFLILGLPILLNTLSLALLMGSPDYRYQFPVVMASIFVTLFVLSSGAPTHRQGTPLRTAQAR